MFNIKFIISTILVSIIILSCSNNGGKSNPADSGRDETTTSPERREVEVIYSLPEEISVKANDTDIKNTGPLMLVDLTGGTSLTVLDGKGQSAAWQNGDMMVHKIWFHNPNEDTIRIKALCLPDSRFKAEWEGMADYFQGLSGGFVMTADSMELVRDYPIVLTFVDNQYPPQLFLLDLYPNMVELRKAHGSTE